MIRPRVLALVAFALSLAACPNDRLVVSKRGNLDAGGDATGAGGVSDPGTTGGTQGTQGGAVAGSATIATASGGASGGDTAAPPITTSVATAGTNGGASSNTPVTPNTSTGGQVVATAGVATSIGGSNAGTDAGGSAGGSTGATGGTSALGGSSGGTTVIGTRKEGPCDIYQAASMPCAAAYSMIRALSKNYQGPLFQVRAGSSSTNNTMSGGTTKDIMPGPDGFVDAATVDEACGSTYCTVSVLYDHSGNENHIQRAQKGNTAGGATGALDDYESIATKGKVKAGGHDVYSLYMNKIEGYRSTVVGKNMPTGQEPQGIYELADGTRKAEACCWDFGNVTTKPATEWAFSNAICLGRTWWSNGDTLNWYGFGIDYGSGIWTGGSKPGDPGWGALDLMGPANPNNPSMDKAKFALGFIRVSPKEYAIRVADLSTATSLTEAYRGASPSEVRQDLKGGIVLGVGGDNSNSSWGTFYEGAIVAGYPSNDMEAAVMKNIKDVGYSRLAH